MFELFIAIGSLTLFMIAFILKGWKKSAGSGTAIIVTRLDKKIVSLGGAFSYPFINSYEYVSIVDKKINIKYFESNLYCADNIKVDLDIEFILQVSKYEDCILAIAESFGVDRMNDQEYLYNYFEGAFRESIENVYSKFNFEEIFDKRESIRDMIAMELECKLSGFRLGDVIIKSQEQSSVESYNPNSILDYKGLQSIKNGINVADAKAKIS